MIQYLPFAASGLGALCCVLLAWGFHLATAEQEVVGGIEVPQKDKTKSDVFILTRISDMIGRPFTGFAEALVNDRTRAKIQRRLIAAGRPSDLTVGGYLQRKTGDILFYGLISIIIYQMSGLLAILVFAYGLALTDLQIYVARQGRQDSIQQTLPDFLDVLSVTVTAGLGFRHALTRVSDSMPGPLADEFKTALRQMELGASRREAFNDLRERNTSEAVGQFVTALLQAEELGAPLSQALTEISADMRREYAQWARRRAQKLNPRITMVTMSTILPGLIILILGAMFLSMGSGLGRLFSG